MASKILIHHLASDGSWIGASLDQDLDRPDLLKFLKKTISKGKSLVIVDDKGNMHLIPNVVLRESVISVGALTLKEPKAIKARENSMQ